MSTPPKLAIFVGAGEPGATHYADSPAFTDFVGGQPLWLSFKWKATRQVADSNTATIRASLLWYDSAGNNFQTTYVEEIVVNASQDLTFKEIRHVAPIGAVKGVCRPQITPAVDPISHDVWIQDLRLGKTQLFSTAGATWGDNIADPNGKMPTDNAGTSCTPRIVDGALTTSGNSVTKAPGWGWNSAAYVLEPIVGAGFFQFRGNSTGGAWIVGLTDDPTSGGSNSYVSIDYGIYRHVAGGAVPMANGNGGNNVSGLTDDTVYTIIYDGSKVYIYAGQMLVQTYSTSSGRTFWLKICQLDSSTIRDIKLGAFAAPSWGNNLLDRPSNLSGLTGSEGINNNLLSIGSNGALLGGGGGQVSLSGLGAGPWADASFNAGQNALFNGSFRLAKIGWTDPDGRWIAYSNWQGSQIEPPVGTGGTFVASSDTPISVVNGQPVVLSAEFSGNSSVNRGCFVDIEWSNGGNDAHIGYSSEAPYGTNAVGMFSGEVLDRVTKSVALIAPNATDGSGFVKAMVRLVSFSDIALPSGAHVIRKVKVEMGTARTPFTDDATNSAELLTRPGTGYRLADGRNTPTNRNFGLRSTYNGLSLTGVDAGNGTAYVSISASSWATDWGSTLSFPAATASGLGNNTQYFFWRNQPDPTTAGDSYGYSTNPNDALGTGKAYLGYCTTPASGGGSTGGGLPGEINCVHPDAWIEMADGTFKRARDIKAGDRIVALNETRDGVRVVEVESNTIGHNHLVRITTESGIAVTLSINTPLTLRDGPPAFAANATGRELPVKDEDGFRWERCVSVQYEMFGEVSHIRCHQATYAAGNERGSSILTHNPKN